MTKRFLTVIMAIGMSVAVLLCGSACKEKNGPIPNGIYFWTGENQPRCYMWSEGKNPHGDYWEIKGDSAQHWVSGYTDYKSKIVSKDDKIFLEGYTWKEMFSRHEHGSDTKYEVIYDETVKSLTLIS